MTCLKRADIVATALSLALLSGPAFAQSPSVKAADQKNLQSEVWRVKHKGNTPAVKRANANERREIAKRDRAASAEDRANARDANAQKWRLAHKGNSPAVQRANAKDQASIDYRKNH